MDTADQAKRVRAARVLAGINSVEELAAKLRMPGLGAKTLGAIERGQRGIRPQELAPLAAALEAPEAFLTDPDAYTTHGESALETLVEELAERIISSTDRHAVRVYERFDRLEGRLAKLEPAAERATQTIRAVDDLTRQMASLLLELELRGIGERRQPPGDSSEEERRDRPPGAP